jgi:hypothetical protein
MSNRWQIHEMEKLLVEASDLEKELPNPTFIVAWMFKVESSLKEVFGEKSQYYQFFPGITPEEISDATVADVSYTQYLRRGKEYLQTILKELRS